MTPKPDHAGGESKRDASHQQHDTKRILAQIHELKSLITEKFKHPETEHATDQPDEHKRNRRPLWGAFVATVLYCIVASFQWCAMRESNRFTREALQITQRSYVTIGRKDGVIGTFRTPDDPKKDAGIVIYFQNSGHLPAKFNWGTLRDPEMVVPPGFVAKSQHPFKLMTRTRNRKDGSEGERNGPGVMIAGDSLVEADVVTMPQEKVLELSQGSNRLFLINGAFESCDELGDYSCKEFMIYYQGAPYNRFSLMTENECIAGFYQVPHPDPNIEYLPPCKTIAEREQKKNQPQH
jgi:hypothetical protein